MDCIITYQKSNGDIIFRGLKHDYGKKIGEETSMGWKVLDIHYRYEGNYYKYDDFWKMIRKDNSLKKRLLRKIASKLNQMSR